MGSNSSRYNNYDRSQSHLHIDLYTVEDKKIKRL